MDSPAAKSLKVTVEVSVIDEVPVVVTILPDDGVESDTARSPTLAFVGLVKIILDPTATPELKLTLSVPEKAGLMELPTTPAFRPLNADATSAGLIELAAKYVRPPTVIESPDFKDGKLTSDVSA